MAVRDLLHDFENFLGKLTPKALFAGDAFQGQPAVVVSEDEIVLMGDKTSLVRVQPDGVQLSGNIALTATPDQIAIASYWRLNPLLLTCLPSTTPTPIPTLVKSMPPLFEGRKQFDDGMQYLMGFSDAPESETTTDPDSPFFGATGEQPEDETGSETPETPPGEPPPYDANTPRSWSDAELRQRIAAALAAARSTDDPGYWFQMIRKASKGADWSYWVGRINTGDGAGRA